MELYNMRKKRQLLRRRKDKSTQEIESMEKNSERDV